MVSPTLPDARRPQSPESPLSGQQCLAGPQRESLGVVVVLGESGYTQQKHHLRWMLGQIARGGLRGR